MRRARLLVLLAVGSLLLPACGSEPPPEPEGPRVVRAEAFYHEGGARVRTFAGVARAGIETQLSFKVTGTVERVGVEIGDQVAAQDLVAGLDDTDYRIQVEDARAALSRQEAAARNAAATYRRTEALYENNNASLADLEAARANDESARAAVESAQKALERAERQLSYTVLRAPIAGSISRVQIEEGENVQPGAPVATLNSGSRVEVEVSVPEMLITGVDEGQTVTVRFSAVPDRSFQATVTEVGVATQGGSSAYPVRARLEEETDEVRPGMAAEVGFTFESPRGHDVMVVPPSAVAEDIEGRYAFVVREDEEGVERVHRTDVRVGDLTSEGLEILSGIEDGDVVVTAGVDRLYEDEAVQLWRPAGGAR